MPDDHYYLGYTFPGCKSETVIPHTQRSNAINILAKQIPYFYDTYWKHWPLNFYAELKEKTGLELLSVAIHENNGSREGLPEALTGLGKLTKQGFDEMLVSDSRLIRQGTVRSG